MTKSKNALPQLVGIILIILSPTALLFIAGLSSLIAVKALGIVGKYLGLL